MIRWATLDDVEAIGRLRLAMWNEMNPERAVGPEFARATAAYWDEMLAAGLAEGWLAEVDGIPVGMAMLLLHDHPPRPSGATQRGYVHSVYVAPEHRQRGLGTALMEAVIGYGREQGLQRLELRTSNLGRILYESVGFESAELMMLRLDQESTKKHTEQTEHS